MGYRGEMNNYVADIGPVMVIHYRLLAWLHYVGHDERRHH